MHISKIHIENFKSFKGEFNLLLENGTNIIVGDNEAGKSTIIEAIHLALTGLMNGRYLSAELTQYIFNHQAVEEYLSDLQKGVGCAPPHILIEIYLEGDSLDLFEGDMNSEKSNSKGFFLKISFDEKYKREYEELIKIGGVKSLPIEYYSILWSSFARDENITVRTIPVKSALIDSSSSKFQNGSDIYISRIIKEFLESNEIVEISQSHRKMKDFFNSDEPIKKINKKILEASKISHKKVEISVELSSKNAWESSLMTYLDDIPFHFIGKGEQCIIKTKLALSHKKAKEASIILLEEPENHLSHSNLNQLISDIKDGGENKQILVSTHSSFVSNKLGLENLIFLNNKKTIKLKDLSADTELFFEKLAGYDTLRLILCKKAILVEGDSDELVVQKAFMNENGGLLPIEKGIDVISVGTSFLRFLEIAEKLDKEVRVVTDNDGDVEALGEKYKDYLGENAKENIKICFDTEVDTGSLKIGTKDFNYNTLEPKFLKANGLNALNKLFGKSFTDVNEMHRHMRANKTDCALKIFDTARSIKFPGYILESIR
ncbi:ATP-dependent nuclease [Flavobacterium nitrogenifigens]|uniref:Putative ATP-dependent endonuclease of the OLD family n=1 Tax=Flavobacterium nitrogenifigens TaxID=1617283 RepID=A0A521B3D9_9FLAO|nr:AAA family ATPase [Flavobacterium nitrogenifigens]KAF2334605.1 AAA family ATPase [Flavobacterium nitrogenifigens]SMO41556.1 putative ATP-dependent endonuclease of the OLD family [Flavobacterium nitrogenifigens]